MDNKKIKIGDRVQSTYRTADGYFEGVVLRVIIRNGPCWQTNLRAEIKWDNGRVETLNQNRFNKK